MTEMPRLAESILELSLSHNKLSDMEAISSLLNKNKIRWLDLGWNQIRMHGCLQIVQALKLNTSLTYLDISFNSITSGSNQEIQVQEALSKLVSPCKTIIWKLRQCLQQNTTLLHIDISFNTITAFELRIIEDGLRQNQTLIGLHAIQEGIDAKVDPLGFLEVDQTELADAYEIHRYANGSQFDAVKQTNKSICWLCDGWVQHTFNFQSSFPQIYIHLDFEEYQPRLMKSVEGRHSLTRMLPPKDAGILFYYSRGDDFANEVIIDPNA